MRKGTFGFDHANFATGLITIFKMNQNSESSNRINWNKPNIAETIDSLQKYSIQAMDIFPTLSKRNNKNVPGPAKLGHSK